MFKGINRQHQTLETKEFYPYIATLYANTNTHIFRERVRRSSFSSFVIDATDV